MRNIFISIIVFLSPSFCHAQITGDTTACPGNIYVYSASIVGASTYSWSVPTNWYELSGQGTSQISITCNANAGQVCVEGFDSLGVSLGIQCLSVQLGGGGGGGWDLQPNGAVTLCPGTGGYSVSTSIVPNGTGGGSCASGCGAGTPHPNLIWAIYNQLWPFGNFVGIIGSSIVANSGSSYFAYHVDTTLGRNPPQAVQIIDGCGGTINNSISFSVIPNPPQPWITQSPDPVCLGDTVLLTENYGFWVSGGGFPFWFVNGGVTALSSPYDNIQFQVLVTNLAAQIYYAGDYSIINPVNFPDMCSAVSMYTINVSPCVPPSSSFQTSTTSLCTNACINFTNLSTNASTYQWIFPGAIPSASTDTSPSNICYASPGSYDVTLISTNSNGADTLTLPNYINVIAQPQSMFSSSQLNFCSGSCTDFTNLSSNATSYQWSFPGAIVDTSTALNPAGICYNTSGQYNVTLISSNGTCTDTLSFSNYITVYPNSFAQAIYQVGDTLISNQGFVTYQWYFNGDSINGATNYFCVATQNGDYSVDCLDSNGCSISAVINNVMTNLIIIQNETAINLSPNPFNGKLFLHPLNSSTEKISISIFNTTEELLLEFQTNLKDQEIDLSKLAKGVYFLVIRGNKIYLNRKLVKL